MVFSKFLNSFKPYLKMPSRHEYREVDYSVMRVLRDKQLRTVFLIFVFSQLCDVISTILGSKVGLYEGNPITDIFIRSIGESGFVWFKFPAFIIVLLGMAKIPKNAALLVVTLGSIGMFFVVISNVVLILTGGNLFAK